MMIDPARPVICKTWSRLAGRRLKVASSLLQTVTVPSLGRETVKVGGPTKAKASVAERGVPKHHATQSLSCGTQLPTFLIQCAYVSQVELPQFSALAYCL